MTAQFTRVISNGLAFAITIGLSACGSGDLDTAQTITYWRTLTGAAGDAQDELVKSFNESQEEVTVLSEFQGSYGDLATKLMTASVANTGPDVTQLGTFEIRQFARSGILVDLTPFLEGPEGLDTSDWPATMLEAGRVDGGIYWLPFNVTVPVLYYNRDAFEEAGLEGPPETWQDLYVAARLLTRKGGGGKPGRSGLALWNITWPLLSAIWSEGGELTTRDYTEITLDHPVVVEVLGEMQQLVREGAASLPDAASGGHRAEFIAGRAAMILDSPAPYEEIMSNAIGFEPGVAMYPAGRKGRVYAPGGGGIAMLETSAYDRRRDAWRFMKHFLAPENMAYYAKRSGYAAFTPKSRSLFDALNDDPNRAAIHNALPYLRADFSVNMSPAVRRAFDRAFQKILIEMADVQETLAAADAMAEREVLDER